MKTVKILGLLVIIVGVFAVGYWSGQNNKTADHSTASSSPQADNIKSESGAMEGHDMSSGSVNVSPEKQQLVGIRTAVAEIRPLVKKIRTVGIVTYDETQVAQVFSKVDGWIEKLFVNYTGKLVAKRPAAFHFLQPGLGVYSGGISPRSESQRNAWIELLKEISAGSDSLLESAHRRLSLWDISEEQIDDLEKTGKPKRTLTFLFADQRFCDQEGRGSGNESHAG